MGGGELDARAIQQQSNIDIYNDPRLKINKVPDTIITCKNFVEAVEKELYGFNWVCPNNGDDCNYMHRLPQGYILQKDKGDKKKIDEGDEMTLEEKIEEDRRNLPNEGLIPVTLTTFMQWKKDKEARKQKELEERIAAEQAKGKKGDIKNFGLMSGKALFTYDPTLFQDDDGAADDTNYEEDVPAETIKNDNEESKEPEVDEALFAEAGGDEEIDFD